jgi:hypothetical protein
MAVITMATDHNPTAAGASCVMCGCEADPERPSNARNVPPMDLLSEIKHYCTATRGVYSEILQTCIEAYRMQETLVICSACQLLRRRYGNEKKRKGDNQGTKKVYKARRVGIDGKALIPVDEIIRFSMDPNSKPPDVRIMKRIILSIGNSAKRGIRNPYFTQNDGPLEAMMDAGYNALVESMALYPDVTTEHTTAVWLALHSEWMRFNGCPPVVKSLSTSSMNRRYYIGTPPIKQSVSDFPATNMWSTRLDTFRAATLAVPKKSVGHYSFRFRPI